MSKAIEINGKSVQLREPYSAPVVPLVVMEDHIKAILAAWIAGENRSPLSPLLIGEAGVGKNRVVYEYARICGKEFFVEQGRFFDRILPLKAKGGRMFDQALMKNMKRCLVLSGLLIFSLSCSDKFEPSKADLESISYRGKQIYYYDKACWLASDYLLGKQVDTSLANKFIAHRNGSSWVVGFGSISDDNDKFLLAYEVELDKEMKVMGHRKFEPLKKDTFFYLKAAKSIDLTLNDFEFQNRPYNYAVLPAENNQLYVYHYPAQIRSDIFPLGGDVRYLVDHTGSKILEKRILHRNILDRSFRMENGKLASGGIHTAILAPIPEDTDVFHVLSRKPKIPEIIVTERLSYQINVDGSIIILEH